MDIFIALEMSEQDQAYLSTCTAGHHLHWRQQWDDAAPADSELERCEIAFGNLPPAWLEENRSLRWIQLESVGFGEYLSLDWRQLDQRLTVTNLAGLFADSVAQSALAGILAQYRGIDHLVDLQQDRHWVGDALRPELRSLTGAHVVQYGRGAINSRFAELIAPFRCQITGFGRDATLAALDAALASADVLICAAPDTDATRLVFDARRLSRLPTHALFVNVGRGTVVDETALATALVQGNLGGAVLDVTVEEPLPADHPLWRLPNTLLTQHTGGGSDDEMMRKINLFAGNLSRYCAGQPVSPAVDFKRGY